MSSFIHSVSVSYNITTRAPTLTSRSPPKPERSAASTSQPEEEEVASDSEQPALVRFARLKQREQQHDPEEQQQTRTVGARVVNTPPNPDRWSVKDTSVNIASAFHRAAGNIIPAYDTSASGSSSQNTTFNTSAGTMNPNDSWAAGLQPRSNVPRSTSVEYEKETHSIVTRRLAAPPSRGSGQQRKPLSRSHASPNIGDSEGEDGDTTREAVTNGCTKTFSEHIAEASRRLAPASFFMRRPSEEPEPHPDTSRSTAQDKSSSYEYAAEERDFQQKESIEQAVPARRNAAARRNRISIDNKAYQPSVSDLDESESEYSSDDGKRTKKRRTKKTGAAGGPLKTLPVAGYDKRKKKRKSGTKGQDGEGSSEEEVVDESVSEQRSAPPRAPSVHRTSVPPPSRSSLLPQSRYDVSGFTTSFDMESGLQSIQEVEEALQLDDSIIEQVSHSSFSIGALLGRGVHMVFRTFWWITHSIWAAIVFLPRAVGRVFGYVLDLLVFSPLQKISNIDPAPIYRFGKYAAIAFSIYAAWVALNSGVLDYLPSFPTPSSRPPYQAPVEVPSDLSAFATRLLKLENIVERIAFDTERSRTYIEGDVRSQAQLAGQIDTLKSEVQKESTRIEDSESKIRAWTADELQRVKGELKQLYAQVLEAQKESEKHRVPDAASDKEARATLRRLEQRVGIVEGEAKDALELSKSAIEAGAAVGSVATWWNKLATGTDTGLTIKSADGQDVSSLISQIVDSAVSKASKDGLALPDFALYSGGAAVIPSLTSETYELRPQSITGSIVGMVTGNGYAVGRPPVTALHHDIHVGHCWPFPGTQGHLGVKLSAPVYISAVTIDHVPRETAVDLRSAPRQMELWGLIEGTENEEKVKTWREHRKFYDESGVEYTKMLNPEHWVQLAAFTYNVHAPEHTQTFPMPQEILDLGVDFGVVVLAVKSNWGREELTCLYRVRVHGVPLGGWPEPLPESDLNRYDMPPQSR
ncbi:hypothetical protein EIP86_007794 [Pleurotus ostreatoroseus]|nr:hypothetical protein EIP86_007794 [Pleurotus ostreatoroseus]